MVPPADPSVENHVDVLDGTAQALAPSGPGAPTPKATLPGPCPVDSPAEPDVEPVVDAAVHPDEAAQAFPSSGAPVPMALQLQGKPSGQASKAPGALRLLLGFARLPAKLHVPARLGTVLKVRLDLPMAVPCPFGHGCRPRLLVGSIRALDCIISTCSMRRRR